MTESFNVYCDESCHLEHDGINAMGLGGIWCPTSKVKEFNNRIIDIKKRNNVHATAEAKWTKVSPAKKQLYVDLINYFFDESFLKFRVILIPDKSNLDHKKFNQTHDEWYYKMYFDMLKVIFNPRNSYSVYVDIKDTLTYSRTQKLLEVCRNERYDFSHKIIKKIQPIRSEEVQIMQIVDILLGAVVYENRTFPVDFQKSKTKMELIDLIKKRSGYSLHKTTLLREDKFNLFKWEAVIDGV